MLPDNDTPILKARDLSKTYGAQIACDLVELDLYEGEVLAIAGESGSGKSTLLSLLSMQMQPCSGTISYRRKAGGWIDVATMGEGERRAIMRTEWGFVHQDARLGLRMNISAGGNVGERLMAIGDRHYGNIRQNAASWLEAVEINPRRIDEPPIQFSGGMRQRLQIARSMVTRPRILFMDEPTGGLDVSVQARLLDLLRGLVEEHRLAVIVVTHDLAVARLLSHRIAIMRHGRIIETGLTDQVLDDAQQPYTQLLVSSVLPV